METAFSFHPDFWPSVEQLQQQEKDRVDSAVIDYQRNPATPGLRLEKLGGNRFWSLRASQELRVLIAREGPTSVFVRAGHHDAIYNLANRHSFVAPRNGKPGLLEIKRGQTYELNSVSAPDYRTTIAAVSEEEPSIVAHWKTAELGRAGFSEAEISQLRRSTLDTLLEQWPDLDDETFDKIVECSEKSPEDWFQAQLVDDQESTNQRFRDAIVERGALSGLSSLLTSGQLERLMAAPIEEWMIFLHPDQRAIVDRRFTGPARVRGSAGTGKTVVALHRAASLAKRLAAGTGGAQPRRVLFTTFISTLPPVFSRLYDRLPAAIPGAVEFINVDKLAGRVCAQAGQPPRLNPSLVDREFGRACNAVVRSGSPLHRAGLTPRYLRDEVSAVLKGRGVDSLEAYLALDRTGRRTPFNAAMRGQLWALRTEWDRLLQAAQVEDFPDVILRAGDLARRRSEPVYAAAIVDECQDLTLAGLQFVRALVNGPGGEDVPDGLFLVGDGAQKIYPGGFTLAQAGINVRGGSSTVLRLNYRNTREIIEAAMACAGAQPVDDLGDEYIRGDAAGRAERLGARPKLVPAGSFPAQIDYVAQRIRQLQDTAAFNAGDTCVCAPTNKRADWASKTLTAHGLPCQSLADFDGQSNSRVKFGTFHRAKGLEFKVVFLVGLSEGEFPSRQSPRQSPAEYDERRALQISELFVAMTRARDGLFILYDKDPSEVVYDALDYFDEEYEE